MGDHRPGSESCAAELGHHGRPRFARLALEVRPPVSCCGTRPTPLRLDWPPDRWPVMTRSTWRSYAPPWCGVVDRCGPTGESMS